MACCAPVPDGYHYRPAPTRAPWWAPFLVFLAFLTLATGNPALAQDLAGEVLATSGPTMRLRLHQLNAPVRQGSAIHAGDRFRTGAGGRIELRMRDGAILSVGPESEFRIDDYRFDAGTQRAFYSLARGLVRTLSGAIGKIRHEDFQLSTPTAAIGIRGTDFTVEHTLCMPSAQCDDGALPGERLRVTVHEGRVAVASASTRLEVPAGRTVRLAGRNGVLMSDRESPGAQQAPDPGSLRQPGLIEQRYRPILPGEFDSVSWRR